MSLNTFWYRRRTPNFKKQQGVKHWKIYRYNVDLTVLSTHTEIQYENEHFPHGIPACMVEADLSREAEFNCKSTYLHWDTSKPIDCRTCIALRLSFVEQIGSGGFRKGRKHNVHS